MKKLLLVGVVGQSALLGGCASNPDGMTPQHVSAINYKDYDCQQLSTELATVTNRAQVLHGSLDKKATGDAVQVAAGFLLWPMFLLAEGGDGPDAAEYTKLRGEAIAIDGVMNKKGCR